MRFDSQLASDACIHPRRQVDARAPGGRQISSNSNTRHIRHDRMPAIELGNHHFGLPTTCGLTSYIFSFDNSNKLFSDTQRVHFKSSPQELRKFGVHPGKACAHETDFELVGRSCRVRPSLRHAQSEWLGTSFSILCARSRTRQARQERPTKELRYRGPTSLRRRY